MLKNIFSTFIILFTISGLLAHDNDQQYVSRLLAKVLGYRLPNDTVPVTYVLLLEPHMDDGKFTFDGEGTIIFDVQQSVRDVTLHASSYLEIDKSYTRLIGSNGTSWKPVSQRWNSILEFFNIRFNHQLDVGRYSMKMKWKGHDAQDWRGFYRSYYTDSNGDAKFMAATHFQPTAARKAFPCWDEPGLKAEFEIALKHYSNYTALSNMPIRNQIELDGGKIQTNFEKSPIMSTYLVTFIIADYEHLSNDYGNITFYAQEGELDEVRLGLEVSCEVISFMENYTSEPYSLPKMDQITVPQYSSAATEHWGMISYAFVIKYDVDHNIRQRDGAIYLTIHEVSHQWFGNLVTPSWWDDLWLSEAFAVYFSYKIADEIFPKWHGMELFVVDVVNHISYNAEDMTPVVHPIRWYPAASKEIREIFGPVTYRKGAAVLHMLECIVTPEVFQDGIKKYINKFRYSTVTTDDLWQSLQETYHDKGLHPHLNVKEVMDPWIEQTGYPLLKVSRYYMSGVTNVTQSNALDPDSDNLWMIPITFTSGMQSDFDNTKPTHWLPPNRDNYTLFGLNKDTWIIVNLQQCGFYRVNYDYENWKRLADYLNSDNYHKIHVINRAQLLADITYFVKTNELYFEIFIDFLLYLHRETNFLPWLSIVDMIDSVNTILINTSAYDLYSKLMLHLLNNIINHVGFENIKHEDHLDALARYHLVPWACAFDHEGCNTAAQLSLIKHLENPVDYPNLDAWIFCNGLKASNESVWDRIMDSHLANPFVQPGFQYLKCTNNQYLMKKYLSLAMAKNSTRLVNLVSDALSSLISGHRENVDFALEYFINHIDQIREYYNVRDLTHEMQYILSQFSSSIKNSDQYNKFVDFLTSEEKKGKISRVDELLKEARDAMSASQKFASKFYSAISKKTSLFNSLGGSEYVDTS